jgi:hypothetical protein
LTTLQKACLAATFNANPAGCPAGSVIGIAKVTTPVLPVPLTGPVYFVSNGGEAFPDLHIVLQGYGVRVDLVGNTFIGNKGITSTTFHSVPDVPFSTFELYLPEGRYSALAANANLCTTKLTMPTTFTAQNGLVNHQNTKIAVTGCPPVPARGKAHTAHKAGKARKATHQHGTLTTPNPPSARVAAQLNGNPAASAVSASAATGCPNEAARAQLGMTGLPDCRAWEMVSPVDKNGAGISGIGGQRPGFTGIGATVHEGGVAAISADGQRATYASFASFGEAVGSAAANQYVSLRDPSAGWATQNITPPGSNETYNIVGDGTPFRAFSQDLSTGLLSGGDIHREGTGVENPPLAPGAPPGYENNYLRTDPGGTLRSLLTHAPSATARDFALEFLGASPDLNHVVLSGLTSNSSASLGEGEGEEVGKAPELHEWDRATGRFLPVSVLPNGAFAESNAVLGGSGATTGQAISEDGSRVIWTWTQNRLYVREGIGTAHARTVQADAPAGNGEYLTASTDGSKVFFADTEKLTGGSSSGDLYMFEPEVGTAGRLVDLTSDHVDANGAEVLGVLGASADGSYVYFVANGVLAAGASPGTCVRGASPLGAACNLYLWHAGETRLIATLSGADEEGKVQRSWLGVANDWSPEVGLRTARVSRDGLRVVFMSQEKLKTVEFPQGDENTVSGGGSCGTSASGAPLPAQCEEVFSYEAAAGRLHCASCNPSGARPTGPSSIPGGTQFANNRAEYQSRVLSEGEGVGRVFFNSADGLVPQDTNGAEDVYEYQNGHVYLLSGGHDHSGAQFVDASANGNDVLFVTRAQLLPQDTDQLVDLYDARVGGGFPGAPAPVCTGTGCQGVPSAPPIFATPSSFTFEGVGNFPPPTPPPAAKPLTNVQKLTKALAACRAKYHNKHERLSCEKTAHKAYATKSVKAKRSASRVYR